MFTKITKKGFSFVCMFVFMFSLFVGSFFINTKQADAFSINTTSKNVSYSITKVYTVTSTGGEYNSVVLLGCLPGSGDSYDMNNGKPCVSDKTSTTLIGCTPRSGDLYDINTGAKCVEDSKVKVVIGCAPRSNDKYNIITSRMCNYELAKSTTIDKKTVSKKITSEKVATNTEPKNEVKKLVKVDGGNISIDGTNEEVKDATQDDSISGREMIRNSLSASVAKVGSTFKGPMSVWIILLILVIIAGGSYGLYSFDFFGKDEEVNEGGAPVVNNSQTPPQSPVTPVANTTTNNQNSNQHTSNPQVNPQTNNTNNINK